MAKINTYGIKMVGLKKASGSTKRFKHGLDVFYETDTGEVWTFFHAEKNVWSDPEVIRVGVATRHLKMQEIADMIASAVRFDVALAKELEE